MWNMHDFYSCGVKQESDYLHHGGDRVRLDADSKFTKQDRMQSKKKQSPHISEPSHFSISAVAGVSVVVS